jgi:DNA gyrase inhibitor GyrI
MLSTVCWGASRLRGSPRCATWRLRHETQRLKDFVGFHYRSTQPTSYIFMPLANIYKQHKPSLLLP